MPITRFEMLDDRGGFRRARARQAVLLVIAGKANPAGAGSYVGDAYIASRTGFDQRHCRRLRCELRDLGLLQWGEGRGYRGQGTWGSNHYQVSVAEFWQRRGVIARVFSTQFHKLNTDISELNTDISDISAPESGYPDSRLPPLEAPPNREPEKLAAPPLILPQQQRQRWNEIKFLQDYGAALLRNNPNIDDGDLAEHLKEYAAQNQKPYFDAWPGANSPIAQAIINARAIVRDEKLGRAKPPARPRSAPQKKSAVAG